MDYIPFSAVSIVSLFATFSLDGETRPVDLIVAIKLGHKYDLRKYLLAVSCKDIISDTK